MYFDRNRATLVAGPQTLTELALYLTDGGSPADGFEPWQEANLFDGDTIDPTVAGIVEILERPARSVMLEQFDGDQVAVTFVAFDRVGRATIMNGVGGDLLSITATRFDLLPALLTQTLRLNPEPSKPARQPLTTTAGVIERLLDGATNSSVDGSAAPALAAVLGSFRHAWRASGSWHTKPTDSSMTVLFAGAEGLWTVSHGSQSPGSTPNPETPVTLTPVTASELTRLLGDVVTGRAVRPSPQLGPSNPSGDERPAAAAVSGVGS